MQVVVGAGLTGLALAWELHRAGREVVVLEASDHVGGTAGSREVAGIRVDLGSHRLPPSLPAALHTELEQLVELQVRPRRDRVRLDGRWLPFPVMPGVLVRGVPSAAVARAGLDAVRAAARRRAAGDGLRRPTTFLYPRRGFGAVAEAIAEQVPVETGRRVNRLIEQDDRVIVGLSDGRLVSATHVHATVPAWQAASWLGLHEDPLGPPPVQAVVLVYLVLDRRPYTDHQAHHLPDPQVLPARVSEPTSYRDSADDPPDRTVLCAELPCAEGDDVWRATDDALAQRVADDLVRSGLPDPRPVGIHVERLPSVGTAATRQALAAVARAERALTLSSRVTVPSPPGIAAFVEG